MSFIRYRMMRLRKFTKNKFYVLVKYVLFVYISFKMKIGWY